MRSGSDHGTTFGQAVLVAYQTLNLWSDFRDDSVIILIEHLPPRPFESRTKAPARASLSAKQQGIILHIVRRTRALLPNLVQPSNELLPGGDVSLLHSSASQCHSTEKMGAKYVETSSQDGNNVWRALCPSGKRSNSLHNGAPILAPDGRNQLRFLDSSNQQGIKFPHIRAHEVDNLGIRKNADPASATAAKSVCECPAVASR